MTVDQTSNPMTNVGVTVPKGFEAAGVKAGLKVSGNRDVAIVRNLGPQKHAAGVFTSNRVFAAPVQWSREVLDDGVADAVLLNSGCANACTGANGLQDTRVSAEKVAALLDCAPNDVVICSTGLIGSRLPMDKLMAGVDAAFAELSDDGGANAALAIMTTDTKPKTAAESGAGWSIGGMAKGAGMLAPALATMLVVLTTDAVIESVALKRALAEATAHSFDRIDSDGCQSTNDSVIVLASGASGVEVDERAFTDALTRVCQDLAAQLIGDAEGASHDIAITVTGAASEDDALEVARTIARNNLFKCAIYGNDPNWGRVVAAVGTTGAAFEPERLDVSFNGVEVYTQGAIGRDRSECDLTPRQCDIVVNLNEGAHEATILTNDLTHAYVTENADYST